MAKDYPIGKEALKQENDLLEMLYQVTDKFMNTPAGGSIGRSIAEEWLGTFAQLPNLNQDLIDASPAEYKAMLEEEIAASKDFKKFARKSKSGDSWVSYFDSEIKIAKDLLKG